MLLIVGLGPGTLVGSAACDLFLIHALCILVPPRNSIKKVVDLGVWAVDLAWSLWAYVWLYIILLVSVLYLFVFFITGLSSQLILIFTFARRQVGTIV